MQVDKITNKYPLKQQINRDKQDKQEQQNKQKNNSQISSQQSDDFIEDNDDDDNQFKNKKIAHIQYQYQDQQIKDYSKIDDSDQNDSQEESKDKEKQSGKQAVKSTDRLRLRDYQNILFNRSLENNRIIYLPTGKGKTLVSIASMYYYLCKEGQGKKIVFLANTIQLVKQQADSIKRNLQKIMENEQLSNSLRRPGTYDRVRWNSNQIKLKVCQIHGEKVDDIGLTRRKKIQAQLSSKKQILEMFKKSTVIVMIAQMFLNCLRRGYIKITDFSFMVFDQCHHCGGDHPYAGIMREFYFDPPKLSSAQKRKMDERQQQYKLPIIMGLTASPATLQKFNKKKLVDEIGNLCGNLNSRFTAYDIDKISNDTIIEIIKAQQQLDRQMVPDLIQHFQKFRDHRQAYNKINKNFMEYFKCVKEVIEIFKNIHQAHLDLQCDPENIKDIELLVFYDIKQCLLIKIRDIWLELGQFAFRLAFDELYLQLSKVNLRNEQNKKIQQKVMQILGKYMTKFREKYPQCKLQYCSAKVRQLIKLLSKKTSDISETNELSKKLQKVVVFASKRRTVKYLDLVIKKYSQTINDQHQKNYFNCDKVTGYSIKNINNYHKSYLINDNQDPLSNKWEDKARKQYQKIMKDIQQANNQQQINSQQAQSKNIASQMKRMGAIKHGKLLLQVQQKYGVQIQTIKKFRADKFRVLITTSVTEEGFDIPQCKIVISFDKPASLKSYIQIKGRARQDHSKYYIFTTQRTYQQMIRSKQFYDDIINSTMQIAMNQFSDKVDESRMIKMAPLIVKQDEGYQKIIVRQSGAIINTSYALQVLKMYCASLRQPNKLLQIYSQTPHVAFRCMIHFPKTSPTTKKYIIGKSKSNKQQALKSAAFEAVKYLYQQKYIKSDLRPKKQQQLQDERQIQKFEDLQQTKKNEQYRKIFEQQVRIKSQHVSDRKFMRFYFKTITSDDLDFNKINKSFFKFQHQFIKDKFQFQIYLMNFYNFKNMKQLKQNQQNQQIGILLCFQEKYYKDMFEGYQYCFQQSKQKFSLKLTQDKLLLNKQQYERLKKIHEFIISSALNRQAYHYSKLTATMPIVNRWKGQLQKDKGIQQNKKRQYYPILVILKKKDGKYTLDEQCNKNIQAHQKLFKQLYLYHNKLGRQVYENKFEYNLTQNMQQLNSQLKSNTFAGTLIVQSIQKQYCFSKCIITGKQVYNESMNTQKDKKKGLITRNKKMLMMFDHTQPIIKQVLKIVFWNKFKKQKKKQIFEREGKLSIKEVENSKYFLPWEFCIYPLSVSLLFKSCLAVQYLFKAVFQYTLAFSFRTIKLPSISKQKCTKQKITNQQYTFTQYSNIILQHGQSIFQYLADNSGSYLKNIGKTYNKQIKFMKPYYQFSKSKIHLDSINQSSIHQKKYYQSANQSKLNTSHMSEHSFVKHLNDNHNNNNHNNNHNNNNHNNNSNIINNTINDIQKPMNEVVLSRSQTFISEIKVTQMLRVLTSRMYKFNKMQNYQQYQFIGDVVLKMLSTVELFLLKPQFDQSSLHIARANIICNANLHRKAILKGIYKYILTRKCDQLPPPYSYVSTKLSNQPEYYQRTKIRMYDENSQIQGFYYIPGKVHADIVQALIGAFYVHSRDLNDCQLFLYFIDILKKPLLRVKYDKLMEIQTDLPKAYQNFEQTIQYRFKNKGLLIQAFTHSSFKQILNLVVDDNNLQRIMKDANASIISQNSFMSKSTKQFNANIGTKVIPWETFYQRLEFLGDSILDLIVVEYLHDKYKKQDEGTLTALKQAGVSNKTLGMIAISLGMHELILMDHPESDEAMKQFKKIFENFNTFVNYPQKLIQAKLNSIKILGDVFQALVGAIFIDLELDYKQTRAVVMKKIQGFLDHYTNLQTLKKTHTYKYKQFLQNNNYKQYRMIKNTSQGIRNGKFKFNLITKNGNYISGCWQTNEKKAWDLLIQNQFSGENGKQDQGSSI